VPPPFLLPSAEGLSSFWEVRAHSVLLFSQVFPLFRSPSPENPRFSSSVVSASDRDVPAATWLNALSSPTSPFFVHTVDKFLSGFSLDSSSDLREKFLHSIFCRSLPTVACTTHPLHPPLLSTSPVEPLLPLPLSSFHLYPPLPAASPLLLTIPPFLRKAQRLFLVSSLVLP